MENGIKMCPRDLPRYLETDNPLAKYFQQNFDKHNTPLSKLQEKPYHLQNNLILANG
jgi:hypothetical protein